MRRKALFHGAALIGAVSTISGCAPHATATASAPRVAPVEAPAAPRVFITEPDETVSASLPPLVEAAGPAVLFVSGASVRCPEGMALVGDRVCIDRWEATLIRVVRGAETRLSPFASVDGAAEFRAATQPGLVPQGYVSGRQAESACRAAGKRLCTASEWERGCRGPGGSQFPYGNQRARKVCNDDARARHPVIEAALAAGLPRGRAWMEGMNLPGINQLEGGLAKTGEREGCVSPEGLFDMVGNLHEWVADADGTFRGGYYMDTTKNGDGCSYQTTAHDFDYHDYSTGFRCCTDPEPVE